MIVGADLDRLIDAKRSQLKVAFTAHQNAHQALAQAQAHWSALVSGHGPDSAPIARELVIDAEAEIQRLESEEREAATRFKAISEELAQLHRGKYGDWHITWRGPLPSR